MSFSDFRPVWAMMAAKGRPFGWSADPAELAAVEPHGLITQRLAKDQRAVPDPYEQTIGLGAVIGIVGRNQATGPRHILDDDRGIAGNMLAHVAPHGARREIIASARGKPHDKADRLAFVKSSAPAVRMANASNAIPTMLPISQYIFYLIESSFEVS